MQKKIDTHLASPKQCPARARLLHRLALARKLYFSGQMDDSDTKAAQSQLGLQAARLSLAMTTSVYERCGPIKNI